MKYVLFFISTYPDMCTMLREMKTENWAGMTSQLSEDIRNMLIDHNMNPDGCPQPPQQLSIVRYPLRLPEIPTILSWFSDVSIITIIIRQILVRFISYENR